jgi:hypothetical protein
LKRSALALRSVPATARVDAATGKTTYVFSCYNQDQPLDQVDFAALAQRLPQNGEQEKLSALSIDRCLKLVPPPAEREAA